MKTAIIFVLIFFSCGCADRSERNVLPSDISISPLTLDNIIGNYSNAGVGGKEFLWYILTGDDKSIMSDIIAIGRGLVPHNVTVKILRNRVVVSEVQLELQQQSYEIYQDRTRFLFLLLFVKTDIGRKRLYKCNDGQIFVTDSGEIRLGAGLGCFVRPYKVGIKYEMLH